MSAVWCGIDWAERHHDVAFIDDTGKVLVKERIIDDAAGFGRLLELMAAHADQNVEQIPVAIETAQGLLVAALRAAGVRLFPHQPVGGRAIPRPL